MVVVCCRIEKMLFRFSFSSVPPPFSSHFAASARVTQFKASLRKLNDDTTYTIHSAIKWSVKKMNSLNHMVLCIKKVWAWDVGGERERANACIIQKCMSSFNQQFSDRWLGALLCIRVDLICILATINWKKRTAAEQIQCCSSITSLECGKDDVASRSFRWCCMCGLFFIFKHELVAFLIRSLSHFVFGWLSSLSCQWCTNPYELRL